MGDGIGARIGIDPIGFLIISATNPPAKNASVWGNKIVILIL